MSNVPYQSSTTHRRPAPQRTSKGHDAVLGALQESKRKVTVILMSGERLHGTIISRDKFTITVLNGDTRFVIYKHGIEMFFGEEPAKAA